MTTDSDGSIERRSLVAATGLGIATVALPSALAAASPAPDGDGGGSALSGGDVDTVSVAGFTLHTFTSSGTLSVSSSIDVQYLVVGGGGGGGTVTTGSGRAGGGGGGGEVLLSPGFATNGFVTLAPGDYDVVVGTGGAAGQDGLQSSFNGLVADPGWGGEVSVMDGGNGGQGGASGSGNSGGADGDVNANYTGGGGGGDSTVGAKAEFFGQAGAGGAGTEVTGFTAAPTAYGGGGGGGIYNDHPFDGFVGEANPVKGAGTDGGGDGIVLGDDAVPGTVISAATAGAANRGGGGGGGSDGGSGAAGGSGVVIIRFAA